MNALDAAMLLVLALFWGGSYIFIRVAVPSFGPTSLVLARLVLAAVLLYGAARVLGWPLPGREHAGRLVVLGLLNAALPYVLISAAELELTASFAAVLTATVPLFAATYAAMWLGERLRAQRLGGLLAGVIGVGVMVGWSPLPLTAGTALAVFAMLASSASYAGAGVYARAKLRGVPPQTLALGQQLGALVWLAGPGLVFVPRSVPPPVAIGSAVALGVLSTAVAYLLYFRLLERIGPTRSSTVTYLLPVVGLVWGVVLLSEPVSGGMVFGLGMVLVSMMLVNGTGIRLPLPRRRGQAGVIPAPAAERES